MSVHHAIEDESMFPDLRAADQSPGPILERLREEHEGIATVSDVLLAHLRREEDQLLEPIGRLSVRT